MTKVSLSPAVKTMVMVGGLVLFAASCGTRVEQLAQGTRTTPATSPSTLAVDNSAGPEATDGHASGLSDPADPPVQSSPRPTATGTASAAPNAVKPTEKSGTAVVTPARGSVVSPKNPPSMPGPTGAPLPGTPSKGDAAQASRSPLVIGAVAPRSGPAGAGHAPGLEAVQAWVRHVNDRGGIEGHPVQYVIGDDGADPARHAAVVKDLVERRHVVAFVMNLESFGGEGVVDYLVARRIPVIGGELAQEYFYGHPTYFPQASAGDAQWESVLFAVAQKAIPANQTKLGIIVCVEVQGCKVGRDAVKRYAPDARFNVVYSVESSIAQPDYTAECLGARKAGVQVFFTILDPLAIQRLAAACARQGFRPAYGINPQGFVPEQASDPNFEGSVVGSVVFSHALDTTPASAEFQQVMRRYLPGRGLTEYHTFGWVAAKLVERAARHLSEPPSSEDLLKELWTLRNDDLGGLTQPLTFTPDTGAVRRACWFTSIIEDRKFKVFDGGKRFCRSLT